MGTANLPAPATSGIVYASVDDGPWVEIGYTTDTGVPSYGPRHRLLDDEDYLEHVYGRGCALNDDHQAGH